MSSNKKRRELNRAAVEYDLARSRAEAAMSKQNMREMVHSLVERRAMQLEEKIGQLLKEWKEGTLSGDDVAVGLFNVYHSKPSIET